MRVGKTDIRAIGAVPNCLAVRLVQCQTASLGPRSRTLRTKRHRGGMQARVAVLVGHDTLVASRCPPRSRRRRLALGCRLPEISNSELDDDG